jgi:hypothetical protein
MGVALIDPASGVQTRTALEPVEERMPTEARNGMTL